MNKFKKLLILLLIILLIEAIIIYNGYRIKNLDSKKSISVAMLF